MISIIVPIYNVEPYIEKCIDSLIAQTYKDIEIILVDDGSPDRCGEICDQYAKTDKRIVVIHQNNQGVSAARNAGLNAAKGEYIGFCDPDDYVEPEMYRRLYDEMIAADAQMAVCECRIVHLDGKETMLPERGVTVLNQKEALYHFWDVPETIRHSVCNKLFSRDICNHIRFNAGLNATEDAEFVGLYLLRVNKVAFVHEPLYIIFKRAGSATEGKLNGDSIPKRFVVYKMLWEYTRLIHGYNEKHIQAFYINKCYSLYVWYCCKDKEVNKEVIREIRKNIRKQYPAALFNKEIFWKTRIAFFLFAFGVR